LLQRKETLNKMENTKMIELGVNIDHVATLRNARRAAEPDPVAAAILAELGGADGITIHLREDRRHINDSDLRRLREVVRTKLNMEMSQDSEIVAIACEVIPDQATLVLEKRREVTTEGGLNVLAEESRITDTIAKLHDRGIQVSLFLDPDEQQIEAAVRCGSDAVELHTGKYADATTLETRTVELARLIVGANCVSELGMRLHAGHGLNYRNVLPITSILHLAELNIGHGIVSRAVLVGLKQAVQEMKQMIFPQHGETTEGSLDNTRNAQWRYEHIRALSRWLHAGHPVRSREQIQKIYKICKQCDAFVATTNSCRCSGYRVSSHTGPLENIIAFATEECPFRKWH
jgi:pyridoxine 5-phosphate synthase